MEKRIGHKIRLIGSHKDIEKAREILSKLKLGKSESRDRLLIQGAIDEHNLKAEILYDGNNVWSMTRILRNLRQIIKHGTLYDGRKRIRFIPLGSMLYFPATPRDFKPVLSEYFYRFLIGCCGSIAHYDIGGWIATYPTVDDLKAFFKKNEYGKPVKESIPEWKADAKRIVEAIEQQLFPFESYMRKP